MGSLLGLAVTAWDFLKTPLGKAAAGALALALWSWLVYGWGKDAVREQWAAANAKAREAIVKADAQIGVAAGVKDRELSERLARFGQAMKDRNDALEKALRDGGGCVADDALNGLPGWDAGPQAGAP